MLPVSAAGSYDVVVTQGGQSETKAAAYQYDAAVTTYITSVEPKYCGTSGGASVTIQGSGFV